LKSRIKVIPNSKAVEIMQEGEILVVKVNEPSKDGRANRAVIKVLAKHFGVPQDSVHIKSGLRSRNKIIEITDL
jgi:uncharacterized protein (TIGR00251 family)